MQTSRPARTNIPNWPAPSNVTVFVRNLKLLRLDQRPDWPDITTRTFSPSQHDLRTKIKAVEWALYHLFMIWDPEGTQNRLRPFFPPLEPLQSVNLRAALFRALSDLKKNGVLGREAILRKTMLDECKGEKFEEVLAMFSTAVLRRASNELLETNAMRLCTSNDLSTAEHEMLLPLVITYRASLTSLLDERARLQSACDDFQHFLETKKNELATQPRGSPQVPPDIDLGDDEQLAHDIRNMWYGNEEWANAIVEGGARVRHDQALEMPFAESLSLMRQAKWENKGRRTTSDLVADLEVSLNQHQTRLSKLRHVQKSLG